MGMIKNLQKIGTDFDIVAIHKKTGEEKKVNFISVESKTFYSKDDKLWANKYNFSKRGEWDLFLKEGPC